VAKSVEELFKEVGLRPRPGQLEVAEKLAWLIENEKKTLLSAPVGWGKTHAVLAALVSTGSFPVLWLVRTLTLGARIKEDADRWSLHTFTAAGRERACPLAQKLGDAVHDFCQFFRHRCPYARLPPSPLPLVTSWEELVARGTKESWCPYFAQELVDADIVVQSYWRRRRPARVIIVDEAHNLLVPQEREYSVGQLAEAVYAAREHGASERLFRRLQELLSCVLYTSVGEVRLFLAQEELQELRHLYFKALERGDATRLKPLLDLARATAVYVEAERVFLYRPPLSLHVRPVVYISGTAPPEAGQFLGVEAELRVPWTVKARALIVEGLTTKFSEYSARMAEKYKRLLVRVSRQCKRVLVFAASERIARDLRSWVTYEEVIPPSGWEGILLLRARGRFNEGVNLPSECVVVAGAPYLPPEVGSKIAQVYKRAGHPDPVKAAIDMPMIIATLQCVGRAWRDPQKPPTVYLADERFARYSRELEEYMEIQTTSLDKL
jgi:DNA excision repair protein ERCC-2